MLRIAIIGAGPAGCMLARLLLQSDKGIDVTIFENEPSLNYRSQGGTLDLRNGSGLDAIKAAGLWEEFKPHARYDGEALKVADKKLLCYLKLNGSTGEHADYARPEIDRPMLRKLLFESLPEGIVQWDHKLVNIDAERTLHFKNKPSRGRFDLVVGADGAWSKTRAVLCDDKPQFSGIAGHSLVIPDAEAKHKDLYDLVNRGSVFAYSDGKSIMAQQMGDGSISVGLWSVHNENWQREAPFDTSDDNELRAAYAAFYRDWDPRLVAFTQQTESEFIARDLHMLPVGNHWSHKQGVTVIGDAAHLATPFAGIGVNIALHDALLLSRAIVTAAGERDAKEQLDINVESFEQDMFRRALKVQTDTCTNMQYTFFRENAPRNGIEAFILNAVQDEMSSLMIFITPVVYLYYFFFKLFYR